MKIAGIADIAEIWFFRSRRFRAITAISAIGSRLGPVMQLGEYSLCRPARE